MTTLFIDIVSQEWSELEQQLQKNNEMHTLLRVRPVGESNSCEFSRSCKLYPIVQKSSRINHAIKRHLAVLQNEFCEGFSNLMIDGSIATKQLFTAHFLSLIFENQTLKYLCNGRTSNSMIILGRKSNIFTRILRKFE